MTQRAKRRPEGAPPAGSSDDAAIGRLDEVPDGAGPEAADEAPEAPEAPDVAAGETVGDTPAADADSADGADNADAGVDAGEHDGPIGGDELAKAQRALAERTADLQRLQAEYLNYKRRVERDRDLIRENATYAVLTPIIDVLDNIDRAREHGELDNGFKAVAEQLERVVGSLGLTKFGEPGDPFDPTLHDALSHVGEDAEVTVPTAKIVAKAGYKIGDRVVRPAQVLVADPPSDQE